MFCLCRCRLSLCVCDLFSGVATRPAGISLRVVSGMISDPGTCASCTPILDSGGVGCALLVVSTRTTCGGIGIAFWRQNHLAALFHEIDVLRRWLVLNVLCKFLFCFTTRGCASDGLSICSRFNTCVASTCINNTHEDRVDTSTSTFWRRSAPATRLIDWQQQPDRSVAV